jgi:hypothetical protein
VKRPARNIALTTAAAVVAALAFGAGSAGATRECDGLQVCVPVAGPWVVVPTSAGAPRPQVEFQLSCPKGYVVGGLDAELSHRAIDVSFLGRMGSPVNPGISTSRSAVFVASYAGTAARRPTFRPHIGCMPAAGGGVRVPTSATAFPPGEPLVRHVRTVRVRPGSTTVVARCVGRERLIRAAHAFGFFMKRPPSASLVSSVSGSVVTTSRGVAVTVRGDAELGDVRAVVQVQAVCSGAR